MSRPARTYERTVLLTVDDVTPEIHSAIRDIVDVWFRDRLVEGETMLDRLEAYELYDGTYPDVGYDMASAAVKEILRLAEEVWRENNDGR